MRAAHYVSGHFGWNALEVCLTDDLELRALIDNAQRRSLAHDFYRFRSQDRVSLIRTAGANLWSLDFVVDTFDLDEAFLPLASRTDTRMAGRLHLNETPRNNGIGMSRQEFESDRRLYALIAQDLDLCEHTLNIIGRYGRQSLAA